MIARNKIQGINMFGLIKVLRKTRKFLALPDNCFLWSQWPDTNAALAEIDKVIAHLEMGIILNKQELVLLFAPTGQIQEVSISSGWAEEFLALAERFDDEISKV